MPATAARSTSLKPLLWDDQQLEKAQWMHVKNETEVQQLWSQSPSPTCKASFFQLLASWGRLPPLLPSFQEILRGFTLENPDPVISTYKKVSIKGVGRLMAAEFPRGWKSIKFLWQLLTMVSNAKQIRNFLYVTSALCYTKVQMKFLTLPFFFFK